MPSLGPTPDVVVPLLWEAVWAAGSFTAQLIPVRVKNEESEFFIFQIWVISREAGLSF